MTALTSFASAVPATPTLDLAEAVLDTTAALVVVLDPQGRVLRFNRAAETLTGLRAAEVLGRVLWPLVLRPAEAAEVEAAFGQQGAAAVPARHENAWRAADGSWRPVLWTSEVRLDAAGQPELIIATGLDMRAEHEARRAQQDSEARFRALFDASPDGVVLIDPHDPHVPWRIVDCNAAFCRMNGYAHAELVGRSLDLLHDHPMMARRGAELLAWIRREGQAHGEGRHRRRDGTPFVVESASSIVELGGREYVLGLDRDATGRRRTEAQLRALSEQLAFEAQHDPLTGLPTRALLLERLAQDLGRAARGGQVVAALSVDLDGFKRVSDTLGHEAGDRVLREVAARLRGTVRGADTVARLAGDVFMVVAAEVQDERGAARLARRVQAALAQPLGPLGPGLSLSASVGVGVAGPGCAAEELLRQAGLALAEAKRAGGGELRLFTPQLGEERQARLDLEERLRAALHSGGLRLHYQPQLALPGGQLVGIEALARWHDPELGEVPPSRFIPLAEDCGLIVPLGEWVLNEACRQLAEWGVDVPVAVNISPAQLLSSDFTETVRGALTRHGLRGAALKLELTERLALRDPALAARRLRRLKGLGVRLALDDFGAGQSSVSTLLGLPVDELKLDRALLAGLGHGEQAERVTGALLAMARTLGLEVVAEGVETREQLEVLRAQGCPAVQGYLTGRPAEPAALHDLLLGAPKPGLAAV